MSSKLLRLSLMLCLAACGGGGGGNAGGTAASASTDSSSNVENVAGGTGSGSDSGAASSSGGSGPADGETGVPDTPAAPQSCVYTVASEPDVTDGGQHPTAPQAARFLQQASFGGTPAAIAELQTGSFHSWLNTQFVLPRTPHLPCVDLEIARLKAAGAYVGQDVFLNSFWGQAISQPDQLRQRVAFALSQIMVVSYEGALSANHRSIASWYDMLGRNTFGNYRTLLEEMTLHPAMGVYLSLLRNQKEHGLRVPDENYAREVMQLFSIGLHRLNMDGTPMLNGNGRPIDTYSNDDVSGLAKVFTGLSHGGADTSLLRFAGAVADPDRDVIPMQMYPQYHSISQKSFLGVTIAAQGSATVQSARDDLKIALDTLFNHPNTPPFIGRQLIQRLVKSNPSPAYVQRVATAFATGNAYGFGSGLRGDMRAVIAAILLDSEARTLGGNQDGKLREPVLRLAHWGRAFGATSTSGAWKVSNTDNTPNSLAQSPMRSPSVFNFYRPGYVPPTTALAAANLVAPEFQITHETSVAGYLNLMQTTIQHGIGTAVAGVRDVHASYEGELAVAHDVDALLDRIDLLVMAGGMKTRTRQTIRTAIDSIAIPSTSAADTARQQRVYVAILLAMAVPEYLTQK